MPPTMSQWPYRRMSANDIVYTRKYIYRNVHANSTVRCLGTEVKVIDDDEAML